MAAHSVRSALHAIALHLCPTCRRYGTEPPITAADVSLAVRARVEHGFTRVAAREVLAQQAAETNAEPMPILPKHTVVALPSDLSQCLLSARRLIESDLTDDDDDHVDANEDATRRPTHGYCFDRVVRTQAPKNVFHVDVSGDASAPKRQKQH